MVKIEAENLEDAYLKAAQQLACSVTALDVVVIQRPKKKIFGLLGKNAIIVANCKVSEESPQIKQKTQVSEVVASTPVEKLSVDTPATVDKELVKSSKEHSFKEKMPSFQGIEKVVEKVVDKVMPSNKEEKSDIDGRDSKTLSIKTILPDFLSKKEKAPQTDVEKATKAIDAFFEDKQGIEEIAQIVKKEINDLFMQLCFSLNAIDVKVYDESTLLVEFSGEDAALLIGKEGYRYKALSYMLFNWINAKYHLQLRLEIAEFLKNQEESIAHYLQGVYESIDRDGRAQTKILDGVLVQIALKQLREQYHDKYVAIRSTRDGGKYIIINDYNSH